MVDSINMYDLSGALDVETERTLWKWLFARRDLTCLAVSHRRPALRRARLGRRRGWLRR
jgi:hypothetical protein